MKYKGRNQHIKGKMKRRLAWCLTGSLLFSLLPAQNMTFARLAAASETEIVGMAQTEYGLQNPRTENGVTTWDCVYFGNYWQEDTNKDGQADKNDAKTPIKWRVLSVDGDDAFLMADNNLDCQSYNSQNWQITWDNCTMRSWLNGYGTEANKVGMDYSGTGFLNNAFTESERQAIKTTNVVNNDNPKHGTEGGNDTSDKVYLLAYDELTNPEYGFVSSTDNTETRRAVNTAYTAAGGEIQGDNQGLRFEMNAASSSDETNLTDGTEGTITVNRNPTSEIDTVLLYQITKQNGTYTADCRYSTGAFEGVTEDIENHAFIFDTVYSLADTGDYVAIGYTQWGEKTAYLSDAIVPLLVTEQKENDGSENTPGGNGNTPGGNGNTPSGNENTPGGNGNTTGGNENITGGNGNTTGGNSTGGTSVGNNTNGGADKKTSIPKVAKVKKYKVKPKKKGLVLTWKMDTKVSGYEVQVSTRKNFKSAKKISIKKSKSKYKVSKLKSGKQYYVRIRAYKPYKTQDGKTKKAYGKWTVKRIRTLK